MPPAVGGQTTGDPGAREAVAASRVPTSWFEVWGGVARGSPQWGTLGEAPGMNLGLIGLRWTRPLGERPLPGALPRWQLTFDLIPLARISTPLVSASEIGLPCPTASICVLAPEPRDQGWFFPKDSPFGIGGNVFGLTRRFRRTRYIGPFVGGTVGGILFMERVPTTAASSFNFTATGEAGVRIGPTDAGALTIAYRMVHISNGGLGPENPGVLSHMVSIGMHRPQPAPR